MRSSHAIPLLLVALAGCKKAKVVEPEVAAPIVDAATQRFIWTTHAAKGAEVRQVARSVEDCTLSCTSNGQTAWSRPGCVAVDTDYRFVSNDCEQLVILHENPTFDGAHAEAVVGSVVVPGAPAVPLRLKRFMQSSTKLKINGRHVRWLGGVLGSPGIKPGLSTDGNGIEFETIDQVPHALTFAALGAWVDQ